MDTPPAALTAAEAAALLAILVTTEDGRVRAGMTGAELESLLARLGAEGDRYAVVERGRIEDQVFIQARRGEDGVYAVEHRAGGPERQFGVLIAEPGRVAALIAAWARRDDAWLAADWAPIDRAVRNTTETS